MKRLLAGALAALSLAACSDATSPDASPASPIAHQPTVQPDVRADHYIVVYRTNVADATSTTRTLAASRHITLEHTYQSALNGFAAHLDASQLAALRADPNVEMIEPDIIVHAQGTEANPDWGLDRIDQRALPLSKTYTSSGNGAGVNAYIIDTGIRYSHEEFGGRAKFAFDAFGGNGADCMGHGSHVSGTIGGASYGVAKDVSLWSVRVLQCDGSAPLSDIIAGIDWVTAHHRSPAVANMSLGATNAPVLDSAVAKSIRSGVTYVVAAGNYGENACQIAPANLPQVIDVGASDNTDHRWSASDFGTCVTLFAPGVNITSADYLSDIAHVTWSGTSMASPHVAGIAALYLQAHPSATPAQVKQAIVGNATSGKIVGVDGSPNLLAYSGFVGGASAPAAAPAAPSSSFAPAFAMTCASKNVCTFDATSSSVPNGVKSYNWYFGDGSDAGTLAAKISHTYAHTGSFSVKLLIDDRAGNKQSVTKTVTVGATASSAPAPTSSTIKPVIAASCTSGYCAFNAKDSHVPAGASSYNWSFGDGVAATALSLQHHYAKSGTYSVRLQIVDKTGHSATTTRSVTIKA